MKPKLVTLLRQVRPRGSRVSADRIRTQTAPQGVLQTTRHTLRGALREALIAYYNRVDDMGDCEEDPKLLEEEYAWKGTHTALRLRYGADSEPALFIHLLQSGGFDSDPARRTAGAGRALFTRLEARARAQGVRWLVGVSTRLDGERSPLGFWQRMGFEVAFVDPWVAKPEEEAVIVKKLD